MRFGNYQMTLAKMPLAKELTDLTFTGTPINDDLVTQLASGGFLETKHNVVLVGGTGTGKSHIAIGITRALIRSGKKARFFNTVDLVNSLEAEAEQGRGGRTADRLGRVDLVVAKHASGMTCSMNSATCRSRNPAGNCCSI